MEPTSKSLPEPQGCSPTAAIILAAGASLRLGQAKQQLFVGDKTLLQGTSIAALDAGCTPVIVVLGSEMDRIAPDLQGYPVTIAQNPDWQEGMSSSIRTGIQRLTEIAASAESVLLLVCDQPMVDATLLQRLISLGRDGAHPMAACGYNGTVGVPAYFRAAMFADLESLHGSDGARRLLQQHPDEVSILPFPDGSIDIDTMHDVTHFLLHQSGRE